MNEKALTVRNGSEAALTDEQMKAKMAVLTQRTPPNEVKYRVGRGGKKFPYVEHSYVTETLNNAFAFNWSFEVISEQVLDDEVIVKGRLTVRPSEGVEIVKEQYGGSDIERYTNGPKNGRPLSVADNLKAASSDALKKCASLLGIALDLYGRDYPEAQEQEAPPQVVQETPQARMANKAQLDEIVLLGAKLDKTSAEIAAELNVASLADLTEKRAGKVIARLQELTAQPQEVEA